MNLQELKVLLEKFTFSLKSGLGEGTPPTNKQDAISILRLGLDWANDRTEEEILSEFKAELANVLLKDFPSFATKEHNCPAAIWDTTLEFDIDIESWAVVCCFTIHYTTKEKP